MKARFKSEKAKQDFVDFGEKYYNPPGSIRDNNNNRRIANKVKMEQFEVVEEPEGSIFPGWFDIIIDGQVFDSISEPERIYFDFTG